MSEPIKTIRKHPAPLPPAAGQFGLGPHGRLIEPHGYHPAECPSLEQFEARFLIANDPRHSLRVA